jgi:hypothetical protein
VEVAHEVGLQNVGLLHLGDEFGQNSRNLYGFADYVLRHYWFSDLPELVGANRAKVIWVPNGYRTGVGPVGPARTLPFADRQIEGFFAGSMHEGSPRPRRYRSLVCQDTRISVTDGSPPQHS